jgi:hypothetical protein
VDIEVPSKAHEPQADAMVTFFEFESKEYVYDKYFNVYDVEWSNDVLGKFVDGRIEFN